jgi:hypothetical protein
VSGDELQQLKDYIDERTRDMETTLLREFRKWAVRIVSDSKVQKAATLGLSERLTMVEERLDDLDSHQ